MAYKCILFDFIYHWLSCLVLQMEQRMLNSTAVKLITLKTRLSHYTKAYLFIKCHSLLNIQHTDKRSHRTFTNHYKDLHLMPYTNFSYDEQFLFLENW
jgi:hypothetical protein